MTDNNDDRKPAAGSLMKLNALAAAAAQAEIPSLGREDDGSVHYDASLDQQQPAEVTPTNTFETSPLTNATKPSAALGSAALTSDPSCPWKNRQDLLALWKKRYSELLAYRQQHGHVNVPQRYEANPELGRWVKDQRAFRRNNKLNSERIKLLDDLGFVWKIKKPDDFWMEKLQQLKDYKSQEGNLHPPREGAHKTLACWVDRQRRAGKSGKLTAERATLLSELGFVWDHRGDGGTDNSAGYHEVQPSIATKESDSTKLVTSDPTDRSSMPALTASALPSQEGMKASALRPSASTLHPNTPMVVSAFSAPYSSNSTIPIHHSAPAVPLISRSTLAYLPTMPGSSIAVSEMPNYPTRLPPANSPMYPTFAASMMTHPTIPTHTTNVSYLQAHTTVPDLEHPALPTHCSTMPGSSLPINHMIPSMAPVTRSDLPIQPASNLTYSMRGYAPTPRAVQLRAMLEEEEMRVNNIMYHSQRTAQLRAMLEEEERQVSNMMYQHRMNDYAYMYSLEHVPPTWTTTQETHGPSRPPDAKNPPN